MKSATLFLSVALAATLIIAALTGPAESQSSGRASTDLNNRNRRERFRPNGVIQSEDDPGSVGGNATEAPTGFDNRTNGFDE